MRHLRSILYAVVLAPAVWVLCGVGFTQDIAGRARAEGGIEQFTGILLLVLAGTAYAILLLARLSPAGPTLAGLAFLGTSVWVLVDPGSFQGLWSPSVTKEGFDLTLPAKGLAAMLAVPLLCTAVNVRRWRGQDHLTDLTDTGTFTLPFERPRKPGTLVVPGVTGVPMSDATQVLLNPAPAEATQIVTDLNAQGPTPQSAQDPTQVIIPATPGEATQVITPQPSGEATHVLTPQPPSEATHVITPQPPGEATHVLTPQPPGEATHVITSQPPGEATQVLRPGDVGEATQVITTRPAVRPGAGTVEPPGDRTQVISIPVSPGERTTVRRTPADAEQPTEPLPTESLPAEPLPTEPLPTEPLPAVDAEPETAQTPAVGVATTDETTTLLPPTPEPVRTVEPGDEPTTVITRPRKSTAGRTTSGRTQAARTPAATGKTASTGKSPAAAKTTATGKTAAAGNTTAAGKSTAARKAAQPPRSTGDDNAATAAEPVDDPDGTRRL